jgi:hypothetical protein
MPRVWRGMRMADGRPEVGRAAYLLGVRVGPVPGNDIDEKDGRVQPGTGGMSVAPSVEALPSHRIPRRLREKYPERFPDADGSNRLHCWLMGDGDFAAGPLARDLVLRPDPKRPDKHGFVEPEREMPAAEYDAAIAETREQWSRWEE